MSRARLIFHGRAGSSAPTLGNLTLSASSFTIGTSTSGTIIGATTGSVITSSGLPTGFTINSVARTWAYDGTGTATAGTLTLIETLAGATGSPKSNNIGYSVGSAGGAFTFRDPGMGTAFDSATGYITFGLKPGSQRVWCNNARADDTGDGLTAATAKKTLMAAKAVWLAAGTSAQLMIAESATHYSDTFTSGNWQGAGGASAAYPIAVLSYDPANPADSTKYGRAKGSTMPIIDLDGGGGGIPMLAATSYLGVADNYAVQGVGMSRPLTDGSGLSLGFSGPRNNIVYQNCRFQNTSMGYQGGVDTVNGNILYSKCSFWGSWTTSGGLALYVDWVTTAYFEDVIFYHCGWKIGASRDDTTTNGGCIYFEHDCYFHASNNGGHFNRVVHIDSANDGPNFRGNAAATQIVCWDVPIAISAGGFSTGPVADHRTGGVTITVDDVAVIGGAHINATYPRNFLVQWENTLSGSYIKNVAAFDSPHYTDASSCFVYCNASASLLPQMYITYQNVRQYNYGKWLETGGGSKTARYQTFQDCLVDSFGDDGMTPGDNAQPNDVFTSTSLQNGATSYPNAVTRLQFAQNVCTAMGLSSSGTYAQLKKRIVDMMIWRPDVSWSPMIMAETLPKLGLTPIYNTLSFPNMSAETPADVFVYVA